MKINSIDIKPIETYSFKNVKSRKDWNKDWSNIISERQLPILTGIFEDTTSEIEALICASDLQGNVEYADDQILLGEQLAEFLQLLIEIEFNITSDKVGVILAGDLYANPEKRGGYGDIRQVYLNFRDCFRWVIGVMGNHDKLGVNKLDELRFRKESNIFILHKEIKKIDDLLVGGISGIIGNNRKTNRVEENEYIDSLRRILTQNPDVTILHESPAYPDESLDGNEKIRNIIESSSKNLIICGHKFWSHPLIVFKNGTQVLNVNEKVVILRKSSVVHSISYRE